jgi:hypothetical protein
MKPMIAVMGDYNNGDWKVSKPNWGQVGSWIFWGWDLLYPDASAKIEPYLTEAARQGKPVALSVQIFQDWKDQTPVAVYAKIGGKGTTIKAIGKPDLTCPAYGNAAWENEYFTFIRQIAARYDGDPRIHSIWICTGLYGETVDAKDGYNWGGQYFRKFVQRSIVEFSAAFSKTPTFLLGTGTTDRRAFADLCATMNVGFKMNALQPDARNAVFPKNGGGLADCALAVMNDIPCGYEHAFANNEAQMYWSLLYALTFGGEVIDLPVAYLDTLAAMKHPSGEKLWDWVLRMMEGGSFWIARQTAFPTGEWERGYSGAYARGMTLSGGNVTLFAPAAIVPDDLKGYISAYGFGKIDGTVTFIPNHVGKAWAVVSSGVSLSTDTGAQTASGLGWHYLTMGSTGKITLSGQGYVHAVGVDAVEVVPEPLPPDWMEAIAKVQTEQATQATWVNELTRRMETLEDVLTKIKVAMA